MTISKVLLSAAVVSLIAGAASVKADDAAAPAAGKKAAKAKKHKCKGQCGEKGAPADAAHGEGDKAKTE